MSNYYKIGKLFGRSLLAVIILVITIANAAAVVETTTSEIDFTADYSDFNHEDQLVIRKTFDVQIRNTEPRAVTVVPSVINLPPRYNIPAISTVTVPPGEIRTVAVVVEIPHQQDSGRKAIGLIELRDATSNNVIYDTAALIQNTKAMLEIDEIVIDYVDEDGEAESKIFNGNSQRLRLDNKIQPGREITLSFKDIENAFNKDYDPDSSYIKDVIISIEADNDDIFKGDFKEEYKLGALGAEKQEDFEVTFTLNENADEDEYVISIKLEGEDGEGARHMVKTELILKIERSEKDLRITKFSLSPENTISCEEKLLVNLQVKNVGTRSQEDITIQLYSPSLGILKNILVDKLDRFSKKTSVYSENLDFDLSNLTAKPGRYDVELNVFLNDNKKIDQERKVVAIQECTTSEGVNSELITSGNKENNTASMLLPPGSVIISSGQVVKTVEDPYTNEDVLISLIIITMILLLAVIAIFIVVIIKNKHEVLKK